MELDLNEADKTTAIKTYTNVWEELTPERKEQLKAEDPEAYQLTGVKTHKNLGASHRREVPQLTNTPAVEG